LICARRVATLISTFFDMSTSALPVIPAGPAADSCCPAPVGLDRALDAARIAEIAGALAEPVRVNILDVLRRSADPVCQCELLPRASSSSSAATDGPTTRWPPTPWRN
jgi:hypothetical protein